MVTGGRDHSEEFRRQIESIRFHIARAEVRWSERYVPPARPAEVVMDFGCGVQFTPHLMVEAMGVFRALGVDTVGVVGPQWCCGQPYRSDGKPGSGDNMADSSFGRMTAFQPHAMVQWCGAAQVQFGERALRMFGESENVTHVTAFLAKRIEELGEQVPWRRRLDARVLVHEKSKDPMPFADRGPVMRSYDLVPAMLERIPGVTVVGEIRALDRGLPCEADFARLSASEVEGARDELARRAREAGADVVVCEHHLCFREWGKLRSDALQVRHYTSLLASALDVEAADRYHDNWELGDVDAIVERARPQWESWGTSPAEARAIATKLFARRAG